MNKEGYLIPQSDNPDHARLWDETWKRLERFLPNMYRDIFPESASAPATAPAAPEVDNKNGGVETAES